ncbi:MAG: DUF86 domain-containing protein [Muribaculaceae bacterium]|nr:DUF86 domain-containing protein [Muribaculaceae bacterium]
MRDKLRDPLRLKHMLESSRNILNFMEGKTLENLKNDKILFYAVVKNIEIIGEATYRITSQLKGRHPEIPSVFVGRRPESPGSPVALILPASPISSYPLL